MTNKELFTQLENEIKDSYKSGVTMEVAEKLAAKFLYGQIQVSKELSTADLNSKMRKAGVKAIKSAVYMEAATSAEKKPTEAMLSSIVESDSLVCAEQTALDKAEVGRDELERYYNIFREAHIYYRGISKGRFE